MKTNAMGKVKTIVGGSMAAVLLCAAPSFAQFAGPALGVPAQAPQVPTVTADPLILNAPVQDIQINPGDVLSVRIFGQPDYAPPVRVSVDGFIQLPLIGAVQVGGLTVERTQQVITDRLISAGMFISPQVTVQLAESSGQFVTVSGELHAVVPVNGDRRLFEILAAAGSLPPTASHVITVLRPGVEKPIVIDLGTDPARRRRQTSASSRGTPSSFRGSASSTCSARSRFRGRFRSFKTLPDPDAGHRAQPGRRYEGRFNDLRIIRTEGLERKMIKVDISKIQKGLDPDPILQADDILFLPTNQLKAAIKGGGIGTLTGIASILLIAYEQRNAN